MINYFRKNICPRKFSPRKFKRLCVLVFGKSPIPDVFIVRDTLCYCKLNFMCWSHYLMFKFLIKLHSHLRKKTCDMLTKNQNIGCSSWPGEVPTLQWQNTKRASERSDIFLKARGVTFYRSLKLCTRSLAFEFDSVCKMKLESLRMSANEKVGKWLQ